MTTQTVDIETYFASKRKLVDSLLDRFLPSVESEPKTLHQAMRYSVVAGGKRLRPILAMATFESIGGTDQQLEAIYRAMAAIEMVHAYSLIHDDLPCMDDDDLRRGLPTCHKKFGEAVAVLAGDALHDVAFQLMAETNQTAAVIELAQAIGTKGMLGGQMADVEAEGKEVSREQIIEIHSRKTAALIRCSVRVGAMMAGAGDELLARLSIYGNRIGLAFQIIDDILDIEGDQSLLGKKVGADSKKEKATYPKAVGMARAKKDAKNLITEAIDQLGELNESYLKEIALYIGRRDR